MEKLTQNEKEQFRRYTDLFVERTPRFGIKTKYGWRTKKYPLHDQAVLRHLNQEIIIGCISRWYPQYAVLDMDAVPKKRTDEIRSKLGLDEKNSMLCSSESRDSYHLLFRPTYNNKPPTTQLLQNIFKSFIKTHNVELYPQKRRVIRLPFGKYQACLDYEYHHLTAWTDKTYWFSKLDDFNIGTVPGHQKKLNLTTSGIVVEPTSREMSGSFYKDGINLFQYGLQAPSTRHNAQFAVIHYLWRNGVAQDETIRRVWSWIKKKHNGFSKTIADFPHQVKYEIDQQVNYVYTKYDLSTVYPDDTHNTHNGFICKPDIKEITEICKGSIPKMRFLFNIVKYSYPRRFRSFIPVHQTKLIQWSSNRTYATYLNEFSQKGVLRRGKSYSDGSQAAAAFSKNLKLKWKYGKSDEAVLYEGRSVDTLEDTVRLFYEPSDFRSILKNAGAKRTARSKITQKIFTL